MIKEHKLTNLLKVNGAEFELGRLWGRQLSLQFLESGVIFNQNCQIKIHIFLWTKVQNLNFSIFSILPTEAWLFCSS